MAYKARHDGVFSTVQWDTAPSVIVGGTNSWCARLRTAPAERRRAPPELASWGKIMLSSLARPKTLHDPHHSACLRSAVRVSCGGEGSGHNEASLRNFWSITVTSAGRGTGNPA